MNNVLKSILEEILDNNVQIFIDKLSKMNSEEIVNMLSDNIKSEYFKVIPDGKGGATFTITLSPEQVKHLLLELYKEL